MWPDSTKYIALEMLKAIVLQMSFDNWFIIIIFYFIIIIIIIILNILH